MLAIGLAWLLAHLDVRRGRHGALVTGVLGAVTWGSLLARPVVDLRG